MNQNILTTYSLVSIKYCQNDQQFYLTNKSFIRDNVFLTSAMSAKDFQNSLFYVENWTNDTQFKSAIQFGQKVVFRHKISNKYLSHSDQFQQEQNDTTYKLKLSHHKHQFKILPCFQYQTKISNKIRFNEDIHLVTQINGAKAGFLFTKPSKEGHIRDTILGINEHNSKNTSKFSFHSYYLRQKDEQCYTFGSIIWLSHIESTTFISTRSIRNKKQITFEPIKYEKDLQSINGLWLIQSDKFTQGGKLQFESKFRLKNLSTGSYMSFSGNFKMNDNQRVYSMILEQYPTQKSEFVFKSLKGEDNIIKKNSYLILRHQQSKLYIGCRKSNFFPDTQTLKPISYSQFSDQDLFKIIQLGQNQDQALRFILSIGQELQEIQQNIDTEYSLQKFSEDLQIFRNIQKELQKLKNFQKLFQKIQGETIQYIPILSVLLTKYRSKVKRDGSNTDIVMKIMKVIYQILTIAVCENRMNQQVLFNNISCFVEDIFLGLGTQKLFTETFKKNYKVLTKAPTLLPNCNNKNILEATLQMVERFNKIKNNEYWQKLLKVMQFLFTAINDGQNSIDVNQRILSEQFFQSGMFTKIFFKIKIANNRIKIEHEPDTFIQLDRIKNPVFLSVVEQVFKLFSLLCYHRNFISKQSIDKFLSNGCDNNIQVMIAYLNMPISQKLLNSLYSLITNLYIDSSPRINRQKPLSVINFVFNSNQASSIHNEQVQMSERLQTTLLNKMSESNKNRPLNISNLLLMSLNLSLQPTLSHDQLALYKQQINQKLRSETVTIDLLKSLNVLIRLQSYSQAQIIQTFNLLKRKLNSGNHIPQIIIGIMQIFQQIAIYTLEVQMRKMTAYLKYKFMIKQTNINYDKQYQYLLPYGNKILPNIKNTQEINQIIAEYNHQVDVLNQIWPKNDLNKMIFSLFISQQNNHNLQYMEQIYNCMVVQIFHKKKFIQMIMNSIVVTEEQSQTFTSLFQLFKKLNHLTAISQYWLSSAGENKQNLKSYVKYMVEVTNYLHQSYEGNSQYSNREPKLLSSYTNSIVKEDDIYVNRQLLVRNIGFHKLTLEILQSNYFLLEVGNLDQAENSRAHQIFSLCFQFIYGFIFNCRETKSIIHKAWNILDKFQNLPEVGQTRVYRELYKNKIEYIREIKKEFIERIVHKILKNTRTKTNEGCQFNPQYLRYLESIVKVNGVSHKLNLQKFYRSIQKQSTFKKIFFCNEVENGRLQFCLNIFEIKTQDCVQIPFIYHIKILGLVCDMVQSLDSQSTIIKSKLRSIFNINYLFQILAEPDIYSHTGLQAQMRFLLKKYVRKIVLYFIQKNDSINLLHDNEYFINLLNFYYSVFIERSKKIKQQDLNEALYLPYFLQYKEQIQFYLNNERRYFNQQIMPFLERVLSIFKKNPNSIIFSRINRILQDYDDTKMVQYFQFRNMGNKFDKVSLRWLNFVDRDQNNSPEQKFAKLTVVDLLRHPVTKKVIQQENQKFYKLISGQTVKFVDVLIKLISLNMEQQYKQNESQNKFSKIYDRLVLLRNILDTIPTAEQKAQHITFFMESGIIQNFISFSTKLEFDFSKTIIRKIYHQVLKIFIFILSNSQDNKPIKQMYRCLSENQLCFRFWSHLSESILTIEQDTHIQKPIDQVNWSLSNIYLNGEQRDENIYQQGLILIQKLCQYAPFTKFLRYQPLYPSKDFLEILYHVLSFILDKNKYKKLKITVPIAEAAQKVVNCMLSLMIGRNQLNQNFIVDSKYPQIVTEVLKMQNIKNQMNKADEVQRQRLITEVIEFYQKNGIDLSGNLRYKISLLDFSNLYVLNRIKYMILKTLVQAVAGNQRAASKLKFQIPIQLIKINLIWVYEEYKASNHTLTDDFILKHLHEWDKIIDVKDLNGVFLMIGFYLYELIQIFGEEADDKNQDQENVIDDKEKRKQKIISKFFSTISEKDKKKQKLQKLQKEPFAQEMKQYYDSYYQSLQFFKERILKIEVNFHGQLTNVYFPKINICEKMSQNYIQQFKIEAVRISQEEKIKSLLEFEEKSFDYLNGQEIFLKKFQSIPIVKFWFEHVSEDRLRLFALVTCFIQTILFFIENGATPSFVFNDYVILVPSSLIQTLMLILGIINLLVGFDMLIYLLFKKSPILWQILSQKQKQRDESDRQKFGSGRYPHIMKQFVPQFSFSFIYISFLVFSFVHPFFGAFILFDVMNRLELGRQVLRSVKETWFQLLMATILLIMFNYLFALYIYIQFAPFYAPTCQILFQCLLLLVDQSLKSGSGFYGTTNPIFQNFAGLEFDLGFFSQMIYIIIAQKVMLQIFGGTIIDKFSQLRQEAQQIQEDQNSLCYICGQQRFIIDFELEGFQSHIQQTHNPMNYIFYLYYLRKQDPSLYGIIDKYVNECQLKKKKTWIPNETSILKQQKEREKQQEEEEDDQAKMKQYIDKKIKQLKQIRSKNAMIVTELKIDHSKSKT